MNCAFCGAKNKENSKYCSKCGKKLDYISEQPINNKPKGNKTNLLLSIIAIIVLVASIFIITLPVIKNKTTKNNMDTTEISKEIPEDTKEVIDNSLVTNIKDFKYEYGVSINSNPTYTKIENNEFYYVCDVPKNFVYTVNNNDKKLLFAKDNTAVMEICAQQNTGNIDSVSALNSFIGNTGGKVEFKSNGTDWYAAKIIKNNVCYYRKCFVDKYIRWFDFVFPTEYINIYDNIYISHIEDNFKRTNLPELNVEAIEKLTLLFSYKGKSYEEMCGLYGEIINKEVGGEGTCGLYNHKNTDVWVYYDSEYYTGSDSEMISADRFYPNAGAKVSKVNTTLGTIIKDCPEKMSIEDFCSILGIENLNKESHWGETGPCYIIEFQHESFTVNCFSDGFVSKDSEVRL